MSRQSVHAVLAKMRKEPVNNNNVVISSKTFNSNRAEIVREANNKQIEQKNYLYQKKKQRSDMIQSYNQYGNLKSENDLIKIKNISILIAQLELAIEISRNDFFSLHPYEIETREAKIAVDIAAAKQAEKEANDKAILFIENNKENWDKEKIKRRTKAIAEENAASEKAFAEGYAAITEAKKAKEAITEAKKAKEATIAEGNAASEKAFAEGNAAITEGNAAITEGNAAIIEGKDNEYYEKWGLKRYRRNTKTNNPTNDDDNNSKEDDGVSRRSRGRQKKQRRTKRKKQSRKKKSSRHR